MRSISKRDHRDVVTAVSRNISPEPLPRPAVSLNVLAGNAVDFESESVRMDSPAIERHRGKDLTPALGLQYRAVSDAAIPGDQVL